MLLLLASPSLRAQQEQNSQAAPSQSHGSTANTVLEAQPNRPSNSNAAEVLEPGVLQLEYGFSREWGAEGDVQTGLDGEVRFGIAPRAEVRWGGSPVIARSFEGVHERGFGDQIVSGQYQFTKETERSPALAVSYALTIPTADETRGLGSGRVDHAWTFLASKEIHRFTWDFNAGYRLIGRDNSTRFDQNGLVILTFQRPLSERLSLIGEIGAQSRLGDRAPAFATTLWALTWRLRPQIVLDAAIDAGITSGAPHKKILFGITYAVANLYHREHR